MYSCISNKRKRVIRNPLRFDVGCLFESIIIIFLCILAFPTKEMVNRNPLRFDVGCLFESIIIIFLFILPFPIKENGSLEIP